MTTWPWILVRPVCSSSRSSLTLPDYGRQFGSAPHLRNRSLTIHLLGGTNLRVCLVTLQGDGKFELTQTKYRLTEEQKQDDGQKLFDFCAECLKTFVDSNTGNGPGMLKEGQVLPLGFTVSSSMVYLWQCVKN